ncbi:MAG: nucleotidyltransferase family protein [Acinetobacter sp.]|nr:nucleotidyltransferase family protein [Acinetobacter sp.]
MIDRNVILSTAKQFGLTDIKVFGSQARGDATTKSDLDLLVTPNAHTTLFDLCGFKMELEEILGIKVDILTPRSLPKRFAMNVLKDARPL